MLKRNIVFILVEILVEILVGILVGNLVGILVRSRRGIKDNQHKKTTIQSDEIQRLTSTEISLLIIKQWMTRWLQTNNRKRDHTRMELINTNSLVTTQIREPLKIAKKKYSSTLVTSSSLIDPSHWTWFIPTKRKSGNRSTPTSKWSSPTLSALLSWSSKRKKKS